MPFALFKFPTLFGRLASTQISATKTSECNVMIREFVNFYHNLACLQEIFFIQAARQRSEHNNIMIIITFPTKIIMIIKLTAPFSSGFATSAS